MKAKLKFNEQEFLQYALEYIQSTYDKHYVGEDDSDLQIVEFWNMMGSDESTITTCRDVATKYLARYGRKDGRNIQDLFKAIHYITFMAHYTNRRKTTNPEDDEVMETLMAASRIPMANPEE